MAAPDADVAAASVRRRISGKSAAVAGPAAEGLGVEGLHDAAGQGGLSSSRLTIDEARKLIPHGYGVCLHKPTQRFQAAPRKLGGGGSKFLGRFNTFEEATEAVCKFVVENGIDPRSLGTRKRHEGAAPASAAPPAVPEVQADAASAVQAVDSAQDGAVANGTTSGPTPPKRRRSGEGMTAASEPEESKAAVPLAQLAFFEALDQFKHVEELTNLATAASRSQPQAPPKVEAASRAPSAAASVAHAGAAPPPRPRAATAAAPAPNDVAAGARQLPAPAMSVGPAAEAPPPKLDPLAAAEAPKAAAVGPAPPPGAAGARALSASVSCAASAAEVGHESLQQPLATRGSFLDRLDSLSSLGFARCPRSS